MVRCLWVWLGLGLTTAASAAEPIALEEFVKPAQVRELSLSPDGQYLAMIVPREDRSEFVLLDRATLKPLHRIDQGRDKHVANFRWVDDRRLVLSMGVRLTGTEIIGLTGELWSVDAATGRSRYLFGSQGQTGGTNVAGEFAVGFVLGRRADAKQRVLVGIQGRTRSGEAPPLQLARMHVVTGAVQTLGRAPVRYFTDTLTDHEDRLRFISGVEAQRKQRLYYRTGDRDPWTLINDQARTGWIIAPLAFTPDGNEVYARIDEGQGPAYLARYSPATGKSRKVYSSTHASIGEVFHTADQRNIFAVRMFEDRGGYALINAKTPEAQLTKQAMLAFPGQLVIANSFSDDGRYATILVQSDRNAGEYFLYDAQAQGLTQLIRSRPALDPEQLAPTEPIRLTSRDGVLLHGLLTKPVDIERPPLVVLPHGGPYGVVDQWGFDAQVQLLANRGYAVLQLNFRGSGGYGEAFLKSGFGEWGGRMQEDLVDATRWAIGQGHADPQRICLYGGSYGGYAALMGTVMAPELYRCAIGFAGVYDLGLMEKTGDIPRTELGRDYLAEIFEKDPQWLRQRSPALRADEIKASILLIHGGRDMRVPPVQAKRMREALIAAGNPPQWLYAEREGHSFVNPKNRIELYQTILAFLDAQIGQKTGS